MKSVYFQTLGCRLNQAEAERLAQTFTLAGYRVVSSPEDADVKIVNTCTVTAEAGRKSRKAARRAHPGQTVIVTGCHSQVRPDDFTGADLVVENVDKERLAALATERLGLDGEALGMELQPSSRLRLYPLVLDHTRAFVKIQDGCDLRCSFCMTTIARGASQCRSAQAVTEEVRDLVAKGCREVVLTGVHAGSYADGQTDLGALMDRILRDTDLPRLRLSSLEPWNFKQSWIDLWRVHGGRLCRHLHMSLQSGADSVLKRMRRVYDREAFAAKVASLRAAIPHLAVTTDIIVGFPGETPAEHAESRAFVEQMGFAGAHVFPYSPRPGTEAAQWTDDVPGPEKRARSKEMKAVAAAGREAFRNSVIGTDADVLIERRESNGVLSGLTDHYQRVLLPPGTAEPNTLFRVHLRSGPDPDTLLGEVRREPDRAFAG